MSALFLGPDGREELARLRREVADLHALIASYRAAPPAPAGQGERYEGWINHTDAEALLRDGFRPLEVEIWEDPADVQGPGGAHRVEITLLPTPSASEQGVSDGLQQDPSVADARASRGES